VTNVFARGFQSFNAFIGIHVITFDIDPHFGGFSIVCDVNRCHAHESNARVGEFAFDQRFDFFAQGLPNPSAMMLQPALLHDSTSGKTIENIRKLDAGVGARRATGTLFSPAFAGIG
jgi:hypothetical protein